MKGQRYKKGGWYGESYRHYLASKGVSTGRKNKYFAHTPMHNVEAAELDYDEAFEELGAAGEPVIEQAQLARDMNEFRDVEPAQFKFSDALMAPGSLAKDAGTAFADLVRFSKSMDPEDMQRPNYARKSSLTPGVDPTVIDERDVPQGSIRYVDEVTGDIVAYENDELGEAVAVVDEKLRAAEKRGIIQVDPGESIQARIRGADDIPSPMDMDAGMWESMTAHQRRGWMRKHNYKSPVQIRESVTDIPAEIRQDMDFKTGFKLSDAATLPGALAKDAGGAISDMVSFAKDVTSRDK